MRRALFGKVGLSRRNWTTKGFVATERLKRGAILEKGRVGAAGRTPYLARPRIGFISLRRRLSQGRTLASRSLTGAWNLGERSQEEPIREPALGEKSRPKGTLTGKETSDGSGEDQGPGTERPAPARDRRDVPRGGRQGPCVGAPVRGE